MSRKRVDLWILGAVVVTLAMGAYLLAPKSVSPVPLPSPLPASARLTVDGISVDWTHRDVMDLLKARGLAHQERADFEHLFLSEGKNLVVWYGPDLNGETAFDSAGRMSQTGGSSLEADGKRVLAVEDAEEKARALLGPPSKYCPETSHTMGGYWPVRHLVILFHSKDAYPSDSPNNTVRQIYLEGKEIHAVEDRVPGS